MMFEVQKERKSEIQRSEKYDVLVEYRGYFFIGTENVEVRQNSSLALNKDVIHLQFKI